MSMAHIHIMQNGQPIASLWLDPHGHVEHDGSIAAKNAVGLGERHHLGPEHGQQLLDAIVRRLDSDLRVSARHCDKDYTCPHIRH